MPLPAISLSLIIFTTYYFRAQLCLTDSYPPSAQRTKPQPHSKHPGDRVDCDQPQYYPPEVPGAVYEGHVSAASLPVTGTRAAQVHGLRNPSVCTSGYLTVQGRPQV